MAVKFSNNAATELASSIGISDTSITVVDGSLFPALAAGDYTYVTLDADTNPALREIVRVTAISGNTLTVVRAQDGTSAAAFDAGAKVELRLTAALLNDIAVIDPSGEPIGHTDKTQSSISFNNATRTFTIAPTAASFEVWCKGVKYEYSTAQTVVIPNTTGLHFIYFSASGVLSTQMSYFTWEEHAPTAYVYWNATTGTAIYFGDERHGITLDWQTHEYLHRTRGAAIANGFAASGYTTTGLGATDADAQIDIGGGTFFDEDMQVDIVSTNSPVANTWQQDLSGPARIPVLYLSGSAWVIDAPTNFPFKVVAGVPQYNLYSGGTWSIASVSNNEYFVSWILATNNLNYPVLSIISQAPTNQLSQAEAMTFEGLSLSGFPSVEFRPLYKVIYTHKTGFTNSVKASTVAVYDLRSLQSAGVAAALVQDHGNLSGLGDDDHAQYLHVSEVRSPSSAVKNSFLPSQTGNSGKYLSTNGTDPIWEPIPSGSLNFTGDVTGSGNTGSTVSLTLGTSGVVAGQYTKVTVDAKGRVTSATDITSSDVTTALTYTPYNATNPAGYISGNQTVTLSGDVTGSGATAITATLANSGVTAGTYTKVTVDAKGRATSGTTLSAGDIPTLNYMLRSTAVQADPNVQFVSSAYRFDPNANNPTNSYYAIITYGNEGNVTGQLATHFQTGETFTRAYNSGWSAWRTQLDSSNYASGYFKTINGSSIIGTGDLTISVTDSTKLPLSGGTLTGNLTVSGNGNGLYFTDGNNRIYFSGYRAIEGATNGSQLQIGEGYSGTYLQSANIYATTSNHVVLHAGNYTSYSPSLTGSGASGTWSINITGNAATATSATDSTKVPLSGGTMSGPIGRSTSVAGFFQGTYNNVGDNSTKSNPIYTIGSAYNPADTTLSNMYGIGYAHPNATFLSGPGFTGGWGMYVAADGDARVWLEASNGRVESVGDMRSPIFYDRNNTGYYVDPTSTSRLSTINCGDVYNVDGGWFRNYGATGIYNQSYGNHFYSDSQNYWNVSHGGAANGGIRFRDQHDSTIRGYVYANTNNDIGFLSNGGSWRLRIAGGDYTQIDGSSIRAPLYYDSNDTSYYFRPASTDTGTLRGRLNFADYGAGIVGTYSSYRYQLVYAMGAAYQGALDGTSVSGGYGLWYSHPNAGGVASNLSTHGLMNIVNGSFQASLDASMRAVTDMRTPIFYDLNNTGYYLNPDSTSYLYHLVLSGAVYFRPSGWIQLDGIYGLYWPNHYGLHVRANDQSTYTQLCIQGSKNSYGGILDLYSNVNGIMYDSGGNGGVYREANGRWYLYHNVGNNCMGVGTSTTSSSYYMYVGGGIYSTGNVVAYSDARSKTNVVTVDSALDKVSKLRGVYYTRLPGRDLEIDTNRREIGVIAQEVNEVIPEVVTYAKDVDEYGVQYGNFAGLFIEAFKELKAEVEALRAEVSTLRGRLRE